MRDIVQIAKDADLIVNGYAFTLQQGLVRVLNLDAPDSAVVMTRDGDVLETTMDDIEVQIVRDYLRRDLKYLEAAHA